MQRKITKNKRRKGSKNDACINSIAPTLAIMGTQVSERDSSFSSFLPYARAKAYKNEVLPELRS